MPSSFLRSICDRLCKAEQRGAVTLLVVLGSSLIILMIASTLGNHARQELKLSQAETGATQIQLLVNGAFQAVLSKAAADPIYPTPADVVEDCVPADPLGGAAYPRICTDVLAKEENITTLYSSDPSDYYEQIPVRVKWQVAAASPVQYTYGWVVNHSGVLGLQYYHHACTPNPEYPGLNPEPCKQGG